MPSKTSWRFVTSLCTGSFGSWVSHDMRSTWDREYLDVLLLGKTALAALSSSVPKSLSPMWRKVRSHSSPLGGMLVVAELCGLLESKMDGSLLSMSILSSLEASGRGSWSSRASRMSADDLDAQISILCRDFVDRHTDLQSCQRESWFSPLNRCQKRVFCSHAFSKPCPNVTRSNLLVDARHPRWNWGHKTDRISMDDCRGLRIDCLKELWVRRRGEVMEVWWKPQPCCQFISHNVKSVIKGEMRPYNQLSPRNRNQCS
jgi:hypothetical protein